MIWCGSAGLLGFLEREMGLTGVYPGVADRVNRYAEALQRYLDDEPKTFYAKAFDTDDTGVAKDLLSWRDDLVLLGWMKMDRDGQPPRLKTLAGVEKYFADRFTNYGFPDRWMDVLKMLSVDSRNLEMRLLVYDNPKLVHPFFRKLFSILEPYIEFIDLNRDITVEDNNLGMVKRLLLGETSFLKELKPVAEDRSIAIVRLGDNHLAADVLANLVSQGLDPVVICADNKITDHYLAAAGLPASGSTLENSNPQIIQLFKLAAVGLTGPPDVYNLLSLLQAPYSPVPKKLAAALAGQLISKPGIGSQEWKETIERYFTELEEKIGDEKRWKVKRKETELFLTLSFDEKVDPVHAAEVFSVLKGWADRHAQLEIYDHSREERDQFAYLSRLSEVFLEKIRLMEHPVPSLRFLRLAETIYEPATFVNYKPQAGSIARVAAPGCLLDNPPFAWWQDCCNTVCRAGCHDFLYAHEIEYLHKQGLETWLPEHQVREMQERSRRGILAAGEQCILVIPEKYNGEETTLHPVISEIRAFFRNPDDITVSFDGISEVITIPLRPAFSRETMLPEPKTYWQISNPEKLVRRETESASSIEKLIQHPLEWVILYQAKFSAGNSFNLPELFLLKGNVAHTVTQVILNGHKREELAGLTDATIDAAMDRVILEEGLLFLLPQYRFELEDLRRKYKKAIRALVSIITENGLMIKGTELEAENILPGIGKAAGRMDLVLLTKKGEEVIFDLKWTRNNRKYHGKIEDNKDIQLAIYYGLLGSQPKTAYFMLDSNRLYSRHDFRGEHITRVNVPDDLGEDTVLEMATRSFRFRWDELGQGRIEIGDDALLEELDYFLETENLALIPLEADEKKKRKYGDRYSGLELFKGFIH